MWLHPPASNARWRGRATLPVLLLLLAFASGCSTTAYDRGRSALRASEPDLAIQEFNASLDLGEEVFRATRDRGAARMAAGDIAGAIADLEEARRLESDDSRLQWLLGQSYAQAQRPAEAADAFRAYELLSSRRSVRDVVRQKVAQLENQVNVQMAASLSQARRNGTPPEANTVAVYSFAPDAGEDASPQDKKICRALDIWVSTDLAKVSSLRTIAADQLDLIYAERDYTYDNRMYYDPSTLVVSGNLLPARHMVRGLYGSKPDDAIIMGAACFDSELGDAAECSAQNGPADSLFDMETQLVLDILESIGITPTEEEKLAIGVKPTRNLAAFLAYADGIYLRDTGDYEGAQSAFQKAASIDPGFTMAGAAAANSEVMGAPGMSIVVPPPASVDTAGERANSSSLQLGLGLIPDSVDGESTDADTGDVVTARGVASIRVRVRVDQ